jgi:hypothetical protein
MGILKCILVSKISLSCAVCLLLSPLFPKNLEPTVKLIYLTVDNLFTCFSRQYIHTSTSNPGSSYKTWKQKELLI